MKSNIKNFIFLVIFSLLVSVGLIFLGRGSFSHKMNVGIPALWVGAPIFLASTILLTVSFFNKSAGMRKVAIKGFAIVIFLGFQILSLVGGNLIYKKDVREAQNFCVALIPKLERYKADHGKYPSNVNQLGVNRRELPRILQAEDNFYGSNGNEFWISFTDHGGIFGKYIYNVKGNNWAID